MMEKDMPKPRMLAPPVRSSDVPMDRRELAKRELARRLQAMLAERDMNQSDLGRAAEISRENISQYVRGQQFPTPANLKKITRALGFKTTDEWFPEVAALHASDEDHTFSVNQVAGHPGRMWLRINQSVSSATAGQIMALLIADQKRQ